VIEIGESAKKTGSPAHFETDDESPLPGTFNLEDLDDGTIPALDIPNDLLINFEGIFGSLF
jgi:hypothetical protein